jgi:hypothetical protein
MTPTARTLDLLRREGYFAVVCESWLPAVRRRRERLLFDLHTTPEESD